MTSTSEVAPGGRRMRMAADLFRFAVTSLLAGLFAAIAFAALAVLLAQPSYASAAEPQRGTLETRGCGKLVHRLVFRGNAKADYRRLTAISVREGTMAGCARPAHYFARPRSTNTAFISA